MSVLNFRYRERRRTLRVALSLPVVVHGQNEQGEKFCVRAMTRAAMQGYLLRLREARDAHCVALIDANVLEGAALFAIDEVS